MKQQRLWIVMMLTGAVVMGISFYYYRNQPPAADANAARTAQTSSAPAPIASSQPSAPVDAGARASSGPAGPAAEAPAPAAVSPATTARALRPQFYQDGPPAQWFTLGSLETEANYSFRLEVTTEGAAVGTLKLADYFATVADKKLAARYPHNHAQYEKEAAARPDKYAGNYSLLNPLQCEGQRYLPLATRRLDVWLPGSDKAVGWNLHNKQWKLLSGPTTQADGSETIRFAWSIRHDPNYADPEGPAKEEPLLKVVKTYTVRKADYSVAMTLEVVNESNLPLKVSLEQAGPSGLPPEDATDMRQVVIGKSKNGQPVPVIKPRAELAKMDPGVPSVVGTSQEDGKRTLWIGETSKFFGSILYPHPVPAEPNALGWPGRDLQFSVAAALENPQSKTYVNWVAIGQVARDGQPVNAIELAPGKTFQAGFDVFAGPKMRSLFLENALYSRLNYESTIEYGACCGVAWFSWLGPVMLWLLVFLGKIPPHNYGVAIILLVVLVRLAMHPLTKKGQVMMSKTQKMGPAMEKLKQKYADNKEQLQKEMMKLYREQGITPLLGCLPMMLQLPIWAALWGALNAAVELRHAAFLPFWLTDLSAPDAIMQFSFSLPIIGHNLNLLPILGCVSTFIQMKLTPQGAPATTPEQKRQQAMMQYMMPVMMVFMFYSMPSGLNLYIMASGFFAAGEQYVIRKHIREREAAQAATMTVVEAGKAPRGSRTKKPKGPYWFKQG